MKSERKVWRCLVIDDEPLAAGLIASYIESIEELEVAAVCHNALDAYALLRKEHIDIIFVDVQMPKLTGLEFLRTLSNPPAVILTTAFREYAVEGFELDAADYLVKPISLERFLKAVQKVLRHENTPGPESTEDPYLYYRVDRQQVKVFLKDILWIESLKDYIKIVLDSRKTLVTYQRISYAEETLPASLFLRIHRSYIVAKNKVTACKASELTIDKKTLPIGNSYRKNVQKALLK